LFTFNKICNFIINFTQEDICINLKTIILVNFTEIDQRICKKKKQAGKFLPVNRYNLFVCK